jgi:hypothetical protein
MLKLLSQEEDNDDDDDVEEIDLERGELIFLKVDLHSQRKHKKFN